MAEGFVPRNADTFRVTDRRPFVLARDQNYPWVDNRVPVSPVPGTLADESRFKTGMLANVAHAA